MVSRTSTTLEIYTKTFKEVKEVPTEVHKLHRTRKYTQKKSGCIGQQTYK